MRKGQSFSLMGLVLLCALPLGPSQAADLLRVADGPFISGGGSVVVVAEFDGSEGSCGPVRPWRSATERFCGNDSV